LCLFCLAFVSLTSDTDAPSNTPTPPPTVLPTSIPTQAPTTALTETPTAIPSAVPSESPREIPTTIPTVSTTTIPSAIPTEVPTAIPSGSPTFLSSTVPSVLPSPFSPTASPIPVPATEMPTEAPTEAHTSVPSGLTSEFPTVISTNLRSEIPSVLPTEAPSAPSTGNPTTMPSAPSVVSWTAIPTHLPTVSPTLVPGFFPSVIPTALYSFQPTNSQPVSSLPSFSPNALPTPTVRPSVFPTGQPTSHLTFGTTHRPSPSPVPSRAPTVSIDEIPTVPPTRQISPDIRVIVSTEIRGGTTPEPPRGSETVVINTFSQIAGVGTDSVSYLGVSSTLQGGNTISSVGTRPPSKFIGVLMERKGKRKLTAVVRELEQRWNYIFNCQIIYNIVDYPEFNGNNSALISAVKNTITNAFATGKVEEIFLAEAAALNLTGLLNTTVGDYDFQITEVSTSSEGSNSKFNTGVLAGIVVGTIVGACCIWIIVYLLVFYQREKHKANWLLSSQLPSLQNIGSTSMDLSTNERIISNFADDAMIIYLDNDLESSIYRAEETTTFGSINESNTNHNNTTGHVNRSNSINNNNRRSYNNHSHSKSRNVVRRLEDIEIHI
jgi:hypothetical protein